jgi:hypothetical protein
MLPVNYYKNEKLVETLDDFLSGLDLSVADFSVKRNSLTGGKNVVIRDEEKSCSLSKRPGTVLVHDLSIVPTSIYRFYKETTGEKIEVITGGTKLFHETTEIFNAFTSGKDFDFQEWYEDTLYMVNGEDGLFKDNGTSVEDVTPAVLSGYKINSITYRMGRLFVADGSTLYWSELNAPENFDANSLLLVDLEKGSHIIKIDNLFDNIIIFTQRNVHVLRGSSNPDSWELENLNTGRGLIAPKTLINVDQRLVGLSNDGLAVFNGTSFEPFPGWEKVKPIFEQADQETLHKSSSIVWDRKIILSIPSSGSTNNDIHIVYDLDLGIYLPKWEGFEANMYSNFDGKGDTGECRFVSNDGNVYKFSKNVFNDNGTPVEFEAETANIAFVGTEYTKKNKKFRVRAEGQGTLNISYKLDNGIYSTPPKEMELSEALTYDSSIKYDSSLKYDTGIGIQDKKSSNSSQSNYIKYKLSHNEDSDCRIISISQFFKTKKAK